MAHERAFRSRLLRWYQANHRDLPWRRSRNPYRIWISEIMLQQTRVAAVIPYYERFLERFPTVAELAAAKESEVLAQWSGLGYYSRARNLHRAARQIAARGAFPSEYEPIRRLPGVGDYTAAAIASIAFGEARPVVDGNVLRVLARFTNESGEIQSSQTRKRLGALAARLIDEREAGVFNQAVMELGATVCTPQQPECRACPVARYCEGRRFGVQNELPRRRPAKAAVRIEKTLAIVERRGAVLLFQRDADAAQLAGFWELPELKRLPDASAVAKLGSFRHSITNGRYRFVVVRARLRRTPRGGRWVPPAMVDQIPITTTTRKALAIATADVRHKR